MFLSFYLFLLYLKTIFISKNYFSSFINTYIIFENYSFNLEKSGSFFSFYIILAYISTEIRVCLSI